MPYFDRLMTCWQINRFCLSLSHVSLVLRTQQWKRPTHSFYMQIPPKCFTSFRDFFPWSSCYFTHWSHLQTDTSNSFGNCIYSISTETEKMKINWKKKLARKHTKNTKGSFICVVESLSRKCSDNNNEFKYFVLAKCWK